MNRDANDGYKFNRQVDLCPLFSAGSLRAFLASENDDDVSVCAIFDNEEVGSNTKQGALSTFLHDVLDRINGGPVIKEAANQAYTTDAFSRATFAALCADGGRSRAGLRQRPRAHASRRYSSPKLMPSIFASRTRSHWGSTYLSLPATSDRGTRRILPPTWATMKP